MQRLRTIHDQRKWKTRHALSYFYANMPTRQTSDQSEPQGLNEQPQPGPPLGHQTPQPVVTVVTVNNGNHLQKQRPFLKVYLARLQHKIRRRKK